MQAEMTDRGQFTTEHASRYLQQLLKHFGHKIEVEFDETSGRAQFPFGVATLSATSEALTIDLTTATAEDLERGRGVIDSHLKRFSFREDYGMKWAALTN